MSLARGNRASTSQDLSIAIRGPNGVHLLDLVFVVGAATLFMAIGLTLFASLEPLINERLGQGGTLFAVEFAAVAIANVIFGSQPGERVTDTADGHS